MDSRIRLSGITRQSVVDGLGFRYVVFAQGCPHGCKGCHNPSTHTFEGGELKAIDNILQEIRKDSMLDGITCSGGECFEQAEQFAYLAKSVKDMGLNVWAYTGYTFEEIMQSKEERKGWGEFIRYIDVLVDGRYEEDNRDLSLSFRGSTNQRLIDMQKTLSTGKLSLVAI
ncbi:MAG: anaerobic ribonucleoside-triphosphate reductase activating protein [Clostridia bacterium]|jgi:anaerobic ribonucleoside-triphosphate reductase activating protein|nr:anaerobic ribonucleoside-triphosphate reductase activating protein [Clostridia bacterium]